MESSPTKRFAFSKQQKTPSEGDRSLTFREFVCKVKPSFRWYQHCEKLAAVLQRVADGELLRVMVFMPPRHGKSELVSRLFSAYLLYRFSDRYVALATYAADLSYTLSRNARDNFLAGGGQMRGDAKAVRHWETRNGGGMWATGVGGPATGKGFHFGIVDDSLKNAEDAASDKIRRKQKDWWDSTWYTRMEPGAALVVMQTRWHEDDLPGYLLSKEEEEDEAEHWHIVHLEAIKEEETAEYPATCTVEIDERIPGEALCPERYPLDRLEKIREKIGSYYFNGLFQQKPSTRGQGMFDRSWFGDPVDEVPKRMMVVRYWDKAGTEGGDGAESAGVLMGIYEGIIYVISVVHGRWSPQEREKVIRQTAIIDAQDWSDYWVIIEREPGSGGKESAILTIQNLGDFNVRADTPTGDKVTRAYHFSAQAEARNVKLKKGLWNKAYLDQMESFPVGKLKDMVDASSGAYNKLRRSA